MDITDWKPFLDDAFKSLEAAVKSDNAYLDEYYENKSHPTDPSPFALLAVASQVTALIVTWTFLSFFPDFFLSRPGMTQPTCPVPLRC